METLHLSIAGMSCGHCVARVEKALKKLPGVAVIRVDVGSAEVVYDPSRTPFAGIREALDEIGYEAQAVTAHERVA
jgi:copper chaperone CopZ